MKKFTVEECRELVFECEVESSYAEPRRWMRRASTIVEDSGKFYEIEWDQPLTESSGENEFWEQEAREVHKVEKTVVVTQWEKV